MVMCASVDLFQTKLEELFSDIEVVEMYIINTLVHSKYGFTKHVYNLIVVFARLRCTVLQLNMTKWSFWFKYIPYLGCVITWVGIKPDPCKVK